MRRLRVLSFSCLFALAAVAVIGDQGRASVRAPNSARSLRVKGVQIAAAVSPRELAFGGAPVTATLTFTTGALARQVAVGNVPSMWPMGSALGSPLRLFDQTIAGAGHQSSSYASTGSYGGPSQCNRGGPAYDGSGIVVALPAHSTTTVSWRVSLAAKPWFGQALALGWVVYIDTTGKRYHELAMRTIAPVPITRTGLPGVRLKLRAGQGARHNSGFDAGYPWVWVGRPVQILGTTEPNLGHVPVQIGEVSTASHKRRTIATVRTHADGTFQTTWRPRHTGVFTITSSVDHPPTGLLADRSCNLALDVAAHDAAPPAARRQTSPQAATSSDRSPP